MFQFKSIAAVLTIGIAFAGCKVALADAKAAGDGQPAVRRAPPPALPLPRRGLGRDVLIVYENLNRREVSAPNSAEHRRPPGSIFGKSVRLSGILYHSSSSKMKTLKSRYYDGERVLLGASFALKEYLEDPLPREPQRYVAFDGVISEANTVKPSYEIDVSNTEFLRKLNQRTNRAVRKIKEWSKNYAAKHDHIPLDSYSEFQRRRWRGKDSASWKSFASSIEHLTVYPSWYNPQIDAGRMIADFDLYHATRHTWFPYLVVQFHFHVVYDLKREEIISVYLLPKLQRTLW